MVSIIGANGAGKSTILKALVGLVPIRGGDIVFEGESLAGLETADSVKKGIVLVPEGRQLFPYLSVHHQPEAGGDSSQGQGRYRRVPRVRLPAVSAPEGAVEAECGDSERRRAADARDRERSDGQSTTAVPGRAVSRSRPHRGRAGG